MGFFGSRSSYDRVKADICRDISLHKRDISLSSYGDKVLFDAISADPRLLFHIAEISVSRSSFSSVAHIVYTSEKINPELTEYSTDEADAEGIIRFFLCRFKPKLYLILPRTINAQKLVENVIGKYSVMYPAFRNCSYKYAEMSFVPFTKLELSLNYAISRYQLSQMERQLNGEILTVSKKIFLPNMPPLVKAYVAHNYLARTITYWKAEPKTPEELVVRHSAYGAFVAHRCVCQGFSDAFQRLMDSQGISCYILHGKVYSDPSGPHAWNLVALKEGAFHVDATWDAQPTGAINTYFGMTDAYLTPLREWNHHFGKPARSGINWVKEAKRIISANLSEYLRKGIDRKYLVL